MQCKWVVVSLAAVCLAGSLATGADKEPGQKYEGPQFKSEEFALVVGNVKWASEVNLGKSDQGKHTLEMAGHVEHPKSVDAVCLFERFTVRHAGDENDANILKPARGSSSSTYRSGKYNAFIDGVGHAVVYRTELNRDAAKIRKLLLTTEVIVAQTRTEKQVPAVVMEEYGELAPGLTMRVRSLSMSSRRELTVTAEYRRGAAGNTGAFIEAIYALDPSGKTLGGGRWTQGDPLGKSGSVEAKFPLAGSETHKSFRIVVCTKSEIKPVTFEVTGIFAPK